MAGGDGVLDVVARWAKWLGSFSFVTVRGGLVYTARQASSGIRVVPGLRNTTEQYIAEAFSTMAVVRQLCSVVPF
jgi:hypothetical protein